MKNPNIQAEDFKRILRYNIMLDRLNICNKVGITKMNLNYKNFDEEIVTKIKNKGGAPINQDDGLCDDNMINGDHSYNIAVSLFIIY